MMHSRGGIAQVAKDIANPLPNRKRGKGAIGLGCGPDDMLIGPKIELKEPSVDRFEGVTRVWLVARGKAGTCREKGRRPHDQGKAQDARQRGRSHYFYRGRQES